MLTAFFIVLPTMDKEDVQAGSCTYVWGVCVFLHVFLFFFSMTFVFRFFIIIAFILFFCYSKALEP